MLGLMQTRPLMIADLLRHAARHHGEAEIVSKSAEGALFRYTWRDMERRARRLARALAALGIGPGDRVGTLAWNNHRHLEAYFGVPGMGSICHTINPRLHPDDIAYIINHASDRVLLVDSSFAQLLGAVAPHITDSVRAVVFLTSRADMPQVDLPHGMRLLCYEELIEAADEDYVWPVFDENTASALCYTSGTTGRPKGVLYSHRSTVLHAYGFNTPDGLALRAVDRLLPVVPMFHVNAWGAPYMCAMSGAALVMPGRFLDGPSLASLMNAERVTVTAGVPTVWMGLLQHLRASGERLHTVKRIMTGGSACPPLLISAFGREYGVKMEHGWGMTEVSPVGTYNQPKPAQAGLSLEEQEAFTLKQGRALPGLDMKIVDAEGRELPWDGVRFGDLKVRGNWVAESYFGHRPGSAVDADGWFATGDVAVIDPDGFMRITDRSKDVIKSGGEWISSIELENIAVSHPDVLEAAVIAARHPKWDERPLLLIVSKPERQVSAEEMLRFYEGKVAKWWLPDAVVVVDKLPHTATGKLLKTALRQEYADYLIGGKG